MYQTITAFCYDRQQRREAIFLTQDGLSDRRCASW